MKFKVGDRVVCTTNWCGAATKGLHGIIRVVSEDSDGSIGVEFDHEFYSDTGVSKAGHFLYEHGKKYAEKENGWWLFEHHLIPEESSPTPVTITNSLSLISPPHLTLKERVMCTVASSGYPYAVKCEEGLLFYSDLPNVPNVFKTSEVKGW